MHLSAFIVALTALVAADAAEKGKEGRKLARQNFLRRHQALKKDIKEAEKVNASAETGSNVRKLDRDYSGRFRTLQQDILVMSVPMTEMSMIDEVDTDGNEDATAVTTTMATTMPEEDDTPPGFSVQSIHCTWQEGFEKYLMKPRKACRQLNDGKHTVPYLCDGAYKNVCCTISDLKNPTMKFFGTCNKFGDVIGDVDEEATPNPSPSPISSPIETEPELQSQPQSDSEMGFIYIQCTWRSTFESMSHAEACTDEKFSVPYACEEGKNICCTVSSIPSPFTSNYGKCYIV